MFLDFLILLRKGGLKVSLNEWLALTEGMEMGLHGQSIRGFFVLCRTLLIKSESKMDVFEELFYQFFKDVSSEKLRAEMERLMHHQELAEKIFEEYMKKSGLSSGEMEEALESRFQVEASESMVESSEKAMGSSDENMPGEGGNLPGMGAGSAVLGSGGKSMVHAAGDRKFRDWRTDSTIDSRQFQMAFRLLRELSRKLDTNEEELDIRGTIDGTCKQGGILDVKMQPPRKNRLKLMVLIDSGGSMKPHEELCSLLFRSLNKANTFQDLKIYYFHNYLESRVYKDPSIDTDEVLDTEWILKNIASEYRVIFVGDAEMALHELISAEPEWKKKKNPDGITWFKRFKDNYEHSIWLHPQEKENNIEWQSESFVEIGKVFPMYRLSIDGLKDGMYKLMENA